MKSIGNFFTSQKWSSNQVLDSIIKTRKQAIESGDTLLPIFQKPWRINSPKKGSKWAKETEEETKVV